MKQGMMMNTIVSAIIGGVIGAGVVFLGLPKDNTGDLKQLTVADLKVDKITITQQASLLNKEGKEDVVLKDGSVLAENVILGKKFIGRQFQGHAIVANRVFTTPDDLIATPMEQWRFFAEIGSSADAGGEIVVRSAAGAASVNKPTNGGALIRAGFNPEAQPQILALENASRSALQLSYQLSEQQKQMLSNSAATPAGAAANFNGNASAPMGATAAAPDANTIR
jgi:hypothetical protein